MKKGFLTVLLASLVLVGCQNYDDQFDDLNAQIRALKSQVDGLSSLSGQVSSLSGTISGRSSGVAAAQAAATAAGTSAQAATAAANAIDLTGLASSLATLQTEVDAVQASLATAATASAVTSLQAELDAIELSLADLLASSNIYSTNVTITNATTLNSALALGNKLNVLNATLTITGYSGMDYTKVQTLADRINTMTGNIVYTAGGSTGTEVVFNNLVSAGDITMTQPGGYHFPKLANAGTIDMKDDYETTVTRVNFPALTSATAIQTDATGNFEVVFTYATSVNFGALVTAPSNTVTITTKKDATLDLGAWLSQDASGNKVDATVVLNGPASFTNGTAAGTFATTGLGGNTLGAHDGSIQLTNVATAAIHNFRGTVTLGAGVKNFTGNNIITVAGAMTDMETINLTMIRDNDPGLSAAAVANLDDSDDNSAQDLSFGSTHAKLTSITMTGKGGDVTADAGPVLTTVNLTGLDAFDIDITNNTALTSYTDASKAEDFEFDNNDVMTSLNASHTTKLTATSDKGVKASITGNAELTSLTIGFDDVNDLDITTNAKLATLAAASLKDNGTDTVAPVDIYDNAFVATLVKDSMESDATRAATGWAVGGSTDTGAITSASGLSTLDTYLADALASTSTVSVWFDSVTKLETQSTYGGAYTDNTASLPSAAFTRNDAAAAAFTGSSRTGYLVYLYNVDVNAGTTTTTGAISKEVQSRTWQRKVNANTLVEPVLGTGEGFTITLGSGTYTFDKGDAYTGSANGTTVATVDDLIAYVNADTSTNSADNVELIAAGDGYNRAAYTIAYTNSPGTSGAVEGVVSTAGNLYFTFGSDTGTGATNALTAALLAGDSQADVADAIMAAITAHADYSAVTATGNANSNRFIVTRNVSGTGGANTSPEMTSAKFPTIDISTGVATTTAVLVATGYNGVIRALDMAAGSASAINARGTASGFFSIPDVSGTYLSGLRLTLRNDGNVALVATTSATIAGASNTAIIANTGDPDGTDNLLVKGVNISTYVASTNEGPASYVAAFSDIASGTTSTTGAVTAVLTNRTGW
jgi:hypothetical protein